MTKLTIFTGKNTLMTSKTAGLSIALFAVASMMFPISSSYALDFETDVSVWDSAVAVDVGNGIYPIGGAGQVSGDFAVDTFLEEDMGIQVGLRAQERFFGPILPTIDNVYFAEAGESDPGLATWNLDWSLDFGTTYLENQLSTDLTPKNMVDFDVILSVDDDPTENTDFVDIDLNAAGLDPVLLFQSSQNMGFDFWFDLFGITFDPDVPGVYDFVLTVSDEEGEVVSTNIQVRVGDTGCSPGFWKTHTDDTKFPNALSQTGFIPEDDFDDVFSLADGTTGDLTLIQALESKGGKENQLYRFAVATLLNAAHPTIDAEDGFDEVSEIIAIVSAVDFEDRTSIRAAVALLAPQTDLIGCPITGEEPVEV